ncbi:MAG TPA: ATP-binding cassette domain-containing protein [Planctomycetota bacterium]|nr:ATP-binding cassette domain-containing protein [Planctomycetota bacterium]HRR82521.1 ATP-binding cassette domain-containing protein [Planctomycetota bacterium]HRT93385.1 ATP-binding cassette domain-containing protein [Planctomycetota bacterium]
MTRDSLARGTWTRRASAILGAFADRRLTIAGLWALGLVGIGLSLVLPSQVGRLTQLFTGDEQVAWPPVLRMILYLVGAQLGLSAISYVRARSEISLRESAIARLTLRLYGRILRFGADFFRTQEVERINARAIEDTSRVGAFWAEALVAVPLAGASIGVLGAVMVLDNWLLGLCMIGLSALSGYFVFFDRQIQAGNREVREAWEAIRARTSEMVAGVSEIRNHGAFDYALGDLARAFRSYQGVTERVGRLVAMFRAMDPLVATVQKGVLFAVGAALCIASSRLAHLSGPMTWARVIKFMLLAQLFQNSITQLSSYLLQWRMTRESARRIEEYLERPCVFEAGGPGEPLPREALPITYDRVSVVGETGQSILRDVTLGVEAGQHIALCGPSGCGKTTLLQTLVRGVEPSGGRCLLGAAPLERYDLLSLARGVGLVPQTPVLLNTSIRQNLLLSLRRPADRCIEDEAGPIDLHRLDHVQRPEQLDQELLALVRLVGLETDLIGKCLDGPLPHAPAAKDLRLRIGKLRSRVARALASGPPDSVVRFDSSESFAGSLESGSYVDALTLRENLLRGRPNSLVLGAPERVDRLIVEALREEGLLDAALLLGLEFIVGEGGKLLSGGQRQKVAIARAVLKNPSLLLLDEATASLDEASQARVLDMIRTRLGRKTVISITHRLSAARESDRIVVMDRGQVVQQGSYDELARQDGMFRWLMQQERGERTADSHPVGAAAGAAGLREELLRKLAFCTLFHGLKSAQLASLAREMQIVQCPKDAVLFRRGDPGRDLYVVLDGQIEFFVERGAEKAAVVVNRTGPGGVFGELATFGQGRRTVGARAAAQATLGVLRRDALVRLLHAEPGIALELLRIVSSHLARTADAAYGEPASAPGVA